MCNFCCWGDRFCTQSPAAWPGPTAAGLVGGLAHDQLGRDGLQALDRVAVDRGQQVLRGPAELNQVHLTNSLVGLALFYVTFNLPFGVFIMRNTFLAIPAELEDAAFVDGAGHWVMVTRVLRPLVLPGVATTVLYAFLFSWTEFLGSLTFITSQKSFTLPVELFNLEVGTYGQVNLGYLVAGAVIAMIPCVVLYVSLQRYYVQGLMSGSLKG